jgi:acyl-homoserine-lactone acylase
MKAALFAAALLAAPLASAQGADQARWKAEAARVTITRDDWGVAHVRGKSDADAVFGMIYAQAEDDFNRIETNYLVSLGRLAEAEGEAAIWQDLRQRLFVDPAVLKADYARSPEWLRRLMQAWADGLNYYLATHPEVRPRVLTRFEPWMALSFSEGSIGGDIERVPLSQLEAFYGKRQVAMSDAERGLLFKEPKGSNGIAIAPSHTRDGHALLLINPHTSFFFRAEQQVTSEEGLNVYGAATWGQFFIYQGFNADAGWMHTSSGVDNVDEFAETIVSNVPGTAFGYHYGAETRPVTIKPITLSYRTAAGGQAQRSFTTYATHHGPIVREAEGKWIAFSLMNRPLEALQQSFLRTKTRDYASFLKVARLKANSSNNTLFADAKGETALLMPQFMPVRDARFDYRKPVDGSDPATDWKGLHALASLPQVLAPRGGWVFNTNNAPWTAAGADSPRAADYPRYLDQAGDNPRGPHAIRVLSARADFTPQTLIAAAFDPWLPAFERTVPGLVAAWERLPEGAAKAKLAGPVALLRGWDYRWGADSRATSLAVFWGEALWALAAKPARDADVSVWDYMAERASDAERLEALGAAVDRLTRDFGSWQVPWGEINRFQRNDGAIRQTFDDAKPSIPVPFASAQWGSLASFGAKRYPGTRRYYGTSGNSFVAVVEFGPKVKAWAVTAGGESGNPESKHFADQAERYAAGALRPVYFYPGELKGHIERVYRPGE